MTFALGILPFVLLLLGYPIFLVLLTAVTVAVTFFMDVPLSVLHQTLFGSVNSFALLAVPFFVYAGELMGRGTIAARLIDFVDANVGSLRGSLGLTTVGSSAIFGAISGVSVATVATIGKVMHPAMIKAGYPAPFAAGLVTAIGALDAIIPPSIPMIIYGAAASASVPRLYAAAVLPGLLIAAVVAAYVIWYARRHDIPRGAPLRGRPYLKVAGRALFALGAPFIILGGIYGGVFSTTEAAAVACVYAAVVTRVVFRELSWRDIQDAAGATALFTGQVLIIVACAGVFSWLITTNQVASTLVNWMQEARFPPWALLLAINVLLLAVGCVLDPLSAILLFTPILLPLVQAAGIDPIHFGIVMMVNLAIGLFTPPIGVNIFVAQSVLGLKTEVIYRGIWPFVLLYLIALGLITYIPAITTSSLRLFMGS